MFGLHEKPILGLMHGVCGVRYISVARGGVGLTLLWGVQGFVWVNLLPWGVAVLGGALTAVLLSVCDCCIGALRGFGKLFGGNA